MNKKIQKGREVALKILKPSKKELEHGLELHANSIVCDAYGLSLHCAPDEEILQKEIAAGASPAEQRCLIEEMVKTRWAKGAPEKEEFSEAWNAAGVTCILVGAGEESQSIPRLLKRFAHITYLIDMMPDILKRAVTPEDIVAAHNEQKRCFYLTCNGVPLPQEWNSVEDELRYIRIFFQLGCRMMHLTYNRRNVIGDGCGESTNGGLSDFGRAAVAEMNRVGVIVDVAHSGWQTSLEAAKVSRYPVVASHSTCWALNKFMRAKPDDVISAIAETEGYIGIDAIPMSLIRTGDIVALLDHIDYAAKKFGAEHVAIGTDLRYTSIDYDRWLKRKGKKTPVQTQPRYPWEELWPDNSDDVPPELQKPEQFLSLSWTNWPFFTVGLVQRGYSDDDIRKIIGGNVLRVAREVIKADLHPEKN